jgi:hypothetical protein
MSKMTIKAGRQSKQRNMIKAAAIKSAIVGKIARQACTGRARFAQERLTVAECCDQFNAALMNAHLLGKFPNGSEVLPGDYRDLEGLQLIGMTEPTDDGDASDLIPADTDTISVSFRELMRGELVFVFEDSEGKRTLRARR